MPGRVAPDSVQRRFERLVALQEGIALERSRAQIGTTVELLIEGTGKKGDATQGRTRTNRIVHVPESLPPGTFARARIVDAAAHHLTGELVRSDLPLASAG